MVMLQDVPKVSGSRTYICPHRIACGADELLKTWTTTIKADMKPISGQRVFGYARWRNDWVKVSTELAHDRRAWAASV